MNSYFDCGWLKSRAKVCRICRVRPDERKKKHTRENTSSALFIYIWPQDSQAQFGAASGIGSEGSG